MLSWIGLLCLGASKPLKPFQGLKRSWGLSATISRVASKPLKPFQGLKQNAEQLKIAYWSCFKASKTLSGIETLLTFYSGQNKTASKPLKPFQGLKPDIFGGYRSQYV